LSKTHATSKKLILHQYEKNFLSKKRKIIEKLRKVLVENGKAPKTRNCPKNILQPSPIG